MSDRSHLRLVAPPEKAPEVQQKKRRRPTRAFRADLGDHPAFEQWHRSPQARLTRLAHVALDVTLSTRRMLDGDVDAAAQLDADLAELDAALASWRSR